MPEEINRRPTDQISSLMFATSPEAVGYLANEGRPVGSIYLVGNPMIDTLMANLDRFDTGAVRATLALPERYVVATLHRPSNVDDPEIAAAWSGRCTNRRRHRRVSLCTRGAGRCWRRPG